jgi:monothiol glutaredoxin
MSDINAAITNLVQANKVVLFMKGNKEMPQCGFSAQTVAALQSTGVDFETVDVLSDPEIRQGIKDFSNWPTIPQLYIDQEFIGGSDIVTQMHANGELHEALGVTFTPPKAPELNITEAFAIAIRTAMENAPGGGSPRLQVSPNFEYGFGMSPESPGDFKVEAHGLTILVDPSSAERADGMNLDFRDGPDGGIVIDNPNEPGAVRRLDVLGYKAMRDCDEPHHLFDVRTVDEYNMAKIEGSTLLDDSAMAAIEDLPKNATIVLHCHHGIRSMQAASQLVERGYRKVYNLEGGIDAWSQQVDTSVPRY